MAEVIMVSFNGKGSGVGELTWGQQHIWGAIEALKSTMNMRATRELPAGASVEEFVDELRFYAENFQSIRTRLKFVPDGLPLQVVVESGEIPIEIVDIGGDEDPAEAAAAIFERDADLAFDYTVDFPIRMTVVRREGVLTHLVTTLSHFVTDAAGALAMYNAYMRSLGDTDHGPEPERLESLELAVLQRTPTGKRQSDASLRYWEEQLRTIPMRRYRDPVDGGGARYWQAELNSPAMFLAVRAIANRLQVDVSTALLGVYTVALVRVTGNNPAVVQMLVSNRFRPGFADMVSNISQTGLIVVDVAGLTVDESIAQAQRALVRTYKNAYFDVSAWRDLITRVELERGGEVELGCYYNDRPSQHRAPDFGALPAREVIEAAKLRTGPLTWTELPFFNERLMVTIDDAPDTVALIVLADTHYVTKEEMETLAREMESLAVAAAFDADIAAIGG